MNPASEYDRQAQEVFSSLNLTPREAEVLFWISQGKSNQDIGMILGAKTGTICKHVEHIFTKLNVENRTSAAVVAIETCRSAAVQSESKPARPWSALAGVMATQFTELWPRAGDICDTLTPLIA